MEYARRGRRRGRVVPEGGSVILTLVSVRQYRRAVPRDLREHLPLKPLVFDVLLALDGGERHGWSLVREIQDAEQHTILPANFYRTLRTLLADGLIEEADSPTVERRRGSRIPGGDGFERRRYFRLTPDGREVARLEARRLKSLAEDSRLRRLLRPTPRKP
jgi:DNA-binding PadR family transcriptional regulator